MMSGHKAHDNDNDNGATGGGPKGAISDSLVKPLAKRFYKDVGVTPGEGGVHQVLLDGRAVRTPAKRLLAVPTPALAEAIAEEWRAQGTHIDPSSMPLTRFANTAIDAVSAQLQAVADDITKYAGSDLICYRAEAPAELVRRQADAWDPVLQWARDDLGARFVLTQGVMPVAQPSAALAAFAAALEPHEAFRLSAMHVLTTLTGSAVLALALAKGALAGDGAWLAAHVDEDYQISIWGEDYEAAERRKARRSEFDAAVRLLACLG